MKKILTRTLLVLVLAVLAVLAAFYRGDVPVEELAAVYADAASRFAEVDGMRVHYKDEGEGPVLVLLHGFADSLHTWNAWAAALAADFRVVRLDLPGHGLTGPRGDGDYRTAAYAEFLGRFLDQLGIERCSVAGNSMGGGIAWLFTARKPERVEKLVLVDAAGAARKPAAGGKKRNGSAVLGFVRLPVVRRLALRVTPRFLFQNALNEVFVDDSKVTEEMVERHYRLALREGNREVYAARLRGYGESYWDLVPGIAQPVLVMWGRGDTWIPVDNGERFHAALPASRLVIYDGVGHLPQVESPARSAADVRAFLLGE